MESLLRPCGVRTGAQAGLLAAAVIFALQIGLSSVRIGGVPLTIAAALGLFPDADALPVIALGAMASLLVGAGLGAAHGHSARGAPPWSGLSPGLAWALLHILAWFCAPPAAIPGDGPRHILTALLTGLLWGLLLGTMTWRLAGRPRAV